MRSVKQGYRNPANGRVHRAHTWCSQCEQVHKTEDWARRGWFCPAGCGGTGLDALPWEFVRQAHAAYPEEPRPGRHYLWRPQNGRPDDSADDLRDRLEGREAI